MIAFLHVGFQPWVSNMVKSIKECMDVPVIQLTDQRTTVVSNVDMVIRKPWDGRHMMLYRMEHLADLSEDFITCDADMVFKKSILDVWNSPFDVALTYRNQPLALTIDHQGEKKGADITKSMPINTGLMFSRSPKFWADCYNHMLTLPEEKLNWWGDQMAVCEIAKQYDVKRLECDEFNWTPSNKGEYNGARVVHYKGIRKKWMH